MDQTLTAQSFLNTFEKKYLLRLADTSIRHGLDYGHAAEAQEEDLAGILGEDGASFVTLRREGQLRGCIGWIDRQMLKILYPFWKPW